MTDDVSQTRSPWNILGWVCTGVAGLSLLACIVMATTRSRGLESVSVTVLDPDREPRDHNLPLIKKHEALPDYELFLKLYDGTRMALGAKPNESAALGLNWQLSDPISLSEIASVRLIEKDTLASDEIAEVQILGEQVESNGFRFDFISKRSFSVGTRSFFRTPIGVGIVIGFGLAVVLMVVGVVNA